MERTNAFGGGPMRTPHANTNRPSTTANSAFRKNDPRQSMAAGRFSLAADARNSITGGTMSFGGCRPSTIPGMRGKRLITVPKVFTIGDKRNLRDRTVHSAMIAKIVNFLADCYNPQPPFNFDDPKFLRIANKNDFQNVFEFIFQNIQPTYQVKKIEDEVIKLVKNLGYPYPIYPSHMQTMTVPDKWPVLLSILEWLVDIVELENNVHAENNNVGDPAKWQLLTSCYKRLLETRGIAATPVSYEQEFETYRQSKLGDDDSEDAFDELRATRVACEEKLKMIKQKIDEERGDVAKIEKTISDLEADIESLQKYCNDLVIKTSHIEQMMIQASEASESLIRAIDGLNAENMEKERQISAQKISGNEARQLVTKRQSIREEISLIKERLGQVEAKIFDLQPNLYRQTANVHSNYNALISGLRSLSESLCNSVELQYHITFLGQYDFDNAFTDLQELSIDSKFNQLIIHLKEFSEQKILAFKNFEESTIQKKASIQKEIRELESAKEQSKTKLELDIERDKRERDDKMRPKHDLKHNLDMVKQKRQATADALGKFTAQLNNLHEELAEKHKKYIDYKRKLDGQYSDLQALVLEKMTKLCDRFQQIQDQKVHYKELAERTLRENSEILQKLDEKGGSKKTKK